MSRPHPRLQHDPNLLHFTCLRCARAVSAATQGTRHRNHCPFCLWSVHVDGSPGDRRCGCHGAMAPVALWVRDDGEWALVHRCERCAVLKSNRVAGDDSPERLLELALRPLRSPAFPLERLEAAEGTR